MNKSRRNARGELSLQTILGETVGLVSRYGYAGTTIARITKVTGKPASSIYWYFDTKDDLVAAALESTYRRQAGGLPAWLGFDAASSLQQQLQRALADDFTAAETEAPVRLGIMIALEGDAGDSPVQEPFRRRRQRARQQISEWWQAAASAQSGTHHETVAEWMTLLTLAFLDGHYISDVEPETVPRPERAQMVAAALASAFNHLLSREEPLRLQGQSPLGKGEAVGRAQETGLTAETTQILLASTRTCVAERGYEGATLEKICERAQIQRSSVYWRYKGKDELIQAAVAEPFLALINAPNTNTIAVSNSWASVLAESVQRSIEAGAENPDTVKAGLLLKLHRRDPLSLGSRAIQLGLASEAEALRKWIAEAVGGSGSEIEVPLLAWLVNVLRDGLLLGLAFGQSYDQSALAELLNSMIFGIVAGAASGVFRSDV